MTKDESDFAYEEDARENRRLGRVLTTKSGAQARTDAHVFAEVQKIMRTLRLRRKLFLAICGAPFASNEALLMMKLIDAGLDRGVADN